MIEYKGYYIKNDKLVPRHLRIVTTGRGGKIPDALEGIFTSLGLAKTAIDTYVGERDAKAVSKGGNK